MKKAKRRSKRFKIIADGHVITKLGKMTFARKEAKEMAIDLASRGYTVKLQDWKNQI